MESKKVPLHLRGQGPGQGVWSTSVCQVPPGQGTRVSGSLCCVGLSQPPQLPRPGKGHHASPGQQVQLQVKAGHVSRRCQHRLCGCPLCSKPLAEMAVADLPAEGPPPPARRGLPAPSPSLAGRSTALSHASLRPQAGANSSW